MEALVPLALLACPIGMGVMMWFMARGMRGGNPDHHGQEGSLVDLKAEQARLGEKIATLEQERAALPSEPEEGANERAPVEVR